MVTSSTPDPAWLHIGTGAFHRAHQAFYLDRLNALGESGWRLIVGNIRPDLMAVEAALRRADGAFHLETVTPQGARELREIRSINQVIGWEKGLATLIASGAAAATRVISFTVTEAGYHLAPDGALNISSPGLADDLAHGASSTIYGAVACMLRDRKAQDAPGVTLLCCDNLRQNGSSFRSRLFDFMNLRAENSLRKWAQSHCSFPDGMVDRITPRATADLRARVFAATGRDDEAAVMAEDYVRWVIEDDFCGGRPQLELVGVEFVAEIQPYEDAKIRVLNASHALLAWRGAALGLSYIHECVAVPALREAMTRYVTDDVIPCLTDSPVDLAAYGDQVMDRFSNPHVWDTVARVAADGFAKIAGWVRPTIEERLEVGAWPVATAGIAAAFLTFLRLLSSNQINFDYCDQTAAPDTVCDMTNAVDPIVSFAHNTELWGRLAGRGELIALLRIASHESAK